MSDKYKIRDDGQIYFLTITVCGWVDLFTRKNHKLSIVNSLRYCQQNKGLLLYGWCLMSNHLHLLAKSDLEISLSEIIRDFKKFTSKELIKEIKLEPESRRDWMLDYFQKRGEPLNRIENYKVWNDGYHAIEISSHEIFKEKLSYIHNNPVDEMIVMRAEDYLFSSAVNYSGDIGLLDVIIEDLAR